MIGKFFGDNPFNDGWEVLADASMDSYKMGPQALYRIFFFNTDGIASNCQGGWVELLDAVNYALYGSMELDARKPVVYYGKETTWNE